MVVRENGKMPCMHPQLDYWFYGCRGKSKSGRLERAKAEFLYPLTSGLRAKPALEGFWKWSHQRDGHDRIMPSS